MAKQTINIGSGELTGDGESLRSAFDKINDNFDEVYTGSGTTLGSDTNPSLGGNLDLSGNDITGIGNLNITGNITATGSISASLAYSNLTNTPTTLAGYGITDGLQLGTSATTALAGNTALFSGAFADLTSKPTTIAGYGITDATSTASPAFTGAVDFSGATSVDFTGATITGTSFLTSVPAQSFASLTGKPTTLAGYGITDAATLNNMAPTGAVDFTGATSVDFTGATVNGLTVTETDPIVGAITGLVKADGAGNISAAVAGTDYSTFDGAFSSLTGKPTTLAGYGITDAASTSATTTFTADVKFDQGVTESFATYNNVSGVVNMDCDHGHLFYVTNATGDITTNLTNFGLTAEYGTNVTIIIDQGNTPYEVTAVQIGGAAQTIVWQGNSAPTGTANGVDSFSFTILNDGGTYVVLGQMVAFGGV